MHLTLAINDSDQVRDLVSGRVTVDGIDLTCLLLEVEEIFFRFTKHREWEVSELSLAKYCSLRSRGDTSLVAIPVFPSRSFRHSAIYIRHDGPVDDPAALRSARIGLPEWNVTANVWARALLQHEYGIDLAGIDWVQAGTNQPGRVETLPVDLPAGIAIRPEPRRSLSDMLVAGDLDAVIAPHAPDALADGTIVRLFGDCEAVERDYYERTGIFPIMHVVVLRDDVQKRYPWAAANLFKAFEEAKSRSIERALDTNAPRTPVPWAPAHAARAERTFGRDFWPYGVAANWVTLDAFLGFAEEQGVCARRLAPEDLFAAQALATFRV